MDMVCSSPSIRSAWSRPNNVQRAVFFKWGYQQLSIFAACARNDCLCNPSNPPGLFSSHSRSRFRVISYRFPSLRFALSQRNHIYASVSWSYVAATIKTDITNSLGRDAVIKCSTQIVWIRQKIQHSSIAPVFRGHVDHVSAGRQRLPW